MFSAENMPIKLPELLLSDLFLENLDDFMIDFSEKTTPKLQDFQIVLELREIARKLREIALELRFTFFRFQRI